MTVLGATGESEESSDARDVDEAVEPEGPGESSLVLDAAGVGHWVTERSPLPAFAPLQVGLALSHRRGVARIGGRLDLLLNPGDNDLLFLYGDLLSVERVYRIETGVRPYWRIALGFALDLVGANSTQSLGQMGYFNADNGAAAGISLAHGWGVDAFLTERIFARLEGDARIHGGAGRFGLLFGAHLGVGWTW